MAAVRGIDDLLPITPPAYSFSGSRRSPAPRWPRRRDGERPACEAHTLLGEEARHQHVYVVWVQLLEDEDLSNPTSITAKQFRTDFLPYPFFLELVKLLVVTPLHRTPSEKNTKTV